MNLARSSLKLFLANFFGAGIQFIGIVFFARELGASQMGSFFLFRALLGVLTIPVDFGLRGAVEKRISEGSSPEAYLSSGIVLKLLPLTIIVLAIYLLRSLINTYLGSELAVLLAASIILKETANLSVAVLKGELRVEETAALNLVKHIVWVLGGAILVIFGYEIVSIVYSLLAGLTLMMIFGWYKSSTAIGHPSLQHARSLINYGKYNMISSLGGYFYNWMDVIIIGLFLSQSAVGAYEVAWQITSVTILLSRAISTSLFPTISAWESEKDREKIENTIAELITPSLALVLPAFFGVVLYSEEILRMVYGEEYVIASVALIVLMFDKVTEAVQLILGRTLLGLDRPGLAARATIVSVGLNLTLNIFLVWKFGLVGAAVATTTASLVGGVLLHGYYLSRIINIRVHFRELSECVIASVFMYIFLLFVSSHIRVDNLYELIIMIILGVITYLVFIILSPSLRQRLIEQFNQIRGI